MFAEENVFACPIGIITSKPELFDLQNFPPQKKHVSR